MFILTPVLNSVYSNFLTVPTHTTEDNIMSWKTVVVLILILIAGLNGWRYIHSESRSSLDIPPEFQERYVRLSRWLDGKIEEWKPEEYEPMIFCAQHIVASEQSVTLTSEELDVPYLEMLKEVGVDCIRLSIYPYNYEKYKQR